ncbi:hypothetical protein BT69DRAFT_1310927 [Atractiella rhizophila]|nr:hypothetical protein BT69DRAFT_1310927 [Atractiella rhizophila]
MAAPNTRGGKSSILRQTPDDVVVVSALRTPITKAKKGGLKDVVPDDLLLTVFKGVIKQSGIDPKYIEDVAVGTVLCPGGGANIARMAALAAGIPHTAAVNTVNRQCSSGLTSINQIALEIQTGEIDIGMTIHYGPGVFPERFSDEVMSNQEAADCLVPMGITSENVATEYKVSRAKQDEFAASSYQKAFKAQKEGKFRDEIVPVVVKDENGNEKTVDKDDGFRDGVTAESLGQAQACFQEGCMLRGYGLQVSDGAAAVLLARRSVAKKLGLPILGRFVTRLSGKAYAVDNACGDCFLPDEREPKEEVTYNCILKVLSIEAPNPR